MIEDYEYRKTWNDPQHKTNAERRYALASLQIRCEAEYPIHGTRDIPFCIRCGAPIERNGKRQVPDG